VLSELKARSKDPEDYAKFWENFGPVLKEGVWEDAEHRKDVAALLRFRSSAAEGWTSLADYVARMKPGQEAIYVLVGDDPEMLARSPQLEGFRRGASRCCCCRTRSTPSGPERLGSFEGKPIRSVTQGAVGPVQARRRGGSRGRREAADLSRLVPLLKDALKEHVSEVRATDRLVDSAAVLAAPEHGPDLQLQRLLRRAGRSFGAALPVLEVNPRHPLLRRLAGPGVAGEELAETAGLLLDLARIQDGDGPRDPAGFARRVAEALAGAPPDPASGGAVGLRGRSTAPGSRGADGVGSSHGDGKLRRALGPEDRAVVRDLVGGAGRLAGLSLSFTAGRPLHLGDLADQADRRELRHLDRRAAGDVVGQLGPDARADPAARLVAPLGRGAPE
jgi:hypothetical protein